MLNRFLLILILTFVYHFSFSFNLLDSIGTTTRAGKTYIVHVVEEGETLYSLSRRYSTTTDALLTINPTLKDGLKAGQRIFIDIVAQNKNSLSKSDDNKTHTVQKGETLYSIAREYNINIKDLKDWNDLPDNNLSVGQVLVLKKTDTSSGTKESSNDNKNIKHSGKTHTVSASETLYSISRTYDISVEDLKSWNNLSSSEISIGQVLVLKNPDSTQQNEVLASTKKETESNSTVNNTSPNKADQKPEINRNATASNASVEMNPSKPAKKKVESGIAEVIEGTAETKKYLALHRTAPIGTIMQVKNEMNNQSVFVRVVGKVPDTGDNNGILIKISKKAYDRLGAVDAKFPVVISYIP